MTPAAYRRGGGGVRIRFVICPSALGLILIARTRLGVCAVLFGDNEDALVDELSKEFPRARIERESCVKEILASLDLDPLVWKLPTALRERVTQARLVSILK